MGPISLQHGQRVLQPRLVQALQSVGLHAQDGVPPADDPKVLFGPRLRVTAQVARASQTSS